MPAVTPKLVKLTRDLAAGIEPIQLSFHPTRAALQDAISADAPHDLRTSGLHLGQECNVALEEFQAQDSCGTSSEEDVSSSSPEGFSSPSQGSGMPKQTSRPLNDMLLRKENKRYIRCYHASPRGC